MKLGKVKSKNKFGSDKITILLILIFFIAVFLFKVVFLPEFDKYRELKDFESSIKSSTLTKNALKSELNDIVSGIDSENIDENLIREEYDYTESDPKSPLSKYRIKEAENAMYKDILKYKYVDSIEKIEDKNNTYRIVLYSQTTSLRDFFNFVDEKVKRMEIIKINYEKNDKKYEYEIIGHLF